MTVDEKLDAVLAALGRIEAAQQQVVVVPSSVLMPYELPALTANDITSPDEHTIQRDGSIWIWDHGFSPQPVGTDNTRQKVCVAYGYVSVRKCPELFALAQKLGGSVYHDFVAEVQAHPYGVWSSNPMAQPGITLDNISIDAFMWAFRVHRIKDYVQ